MSVAQQNRCLHEGFEAQAARTPDNVALVCEGASLTYRELSRRSSQVAARLAPMVREPGQLVGLFIGRSFDLIVGMLGILKAGAAYVPIDPSYPPARIRLLLDDSGVTSVVSRQADVAGLGGVRTEVLVDAVSPTDPALVATPRVTPADAAYVIYTSGSTGTPKGVVVEHRNVGRLFDATNACFGFCASDVWTMFHSISFDFSVWEIWGALLHGGRLIIVPSEVAARPVAFARLVEESGVTVLNQTPTAFGQFARASLASTARHAALRTVIFGGERLDATHLRPWVERHGTSRPSLINMYGITETTVHVTYRPITDSDLEYPERSPIGRPIDDLEVHLLDEHGAEPAPGRPGEMVVTGAGVSRGYLGRPELTAERFPLLPLGPGGARVRCYRSGDLALRANGELLYVGRADDQVKVRGYRIELREVEIQLEKCPEVESCTVVARNFGEGDVRLVAFVVPRAPQSDATVRVSELAARTLPSYMCPSQVVEVGEIPLTAHGKRDREALWRGLASGPADSDARSIASNERVGALQTSVPRVAELARAILQPSIALDVDLFDQGATSLSLARLILDVNVAFGLSLTGAELDGDSSIVNIGAVVDQLMRPDENRRVVSSSALERMQ